MKACICPGYGLPDILSVQEVEKPSPKENEILIRVHAATVNRTDLGILTGKPRFIRLLTGLSRPRRRITGSDFVGIIEATGTEVTNLKTGDRIMGFGGLGASSHAEYMVFPAKKAVIKIPGNMDFETAVSCLEASYYAAISVIQIKPRQGQKAMVYGGTGGIGSAMIQFLKYYGVEITAVCAGEHEQLVRSLGADRIIDYKTQDFTQDKDRYDFVFDAVGKTSFKQCRHLLKRKGIYSPTDGMINLLYTLTTRFSGKKVAFNMPANLKNTLLFIADLAEKKVFKPLIDRTYRLEEAVDAFKYVATKQKLGNVILKIAPEVKS